MGKDTRKIVELDLTPEGIAKHICIAEIRFFFTIKEERAHKIGILGPAGQTDSQQGLLHPKAQEADDSDHKDNGRKGLKQRNSYLNKAVHNPTKSDTQDPHEATKKDDQNESEKGWQEGMGPSDKYTDKEIAAQLIFPK